MQRPTLLAIALLATLYPPLHAQITDAPMPPRLAHQWQRIANLPPGFPILVEERINPLPTQCDLLWIDTHALACTTIDPITGPRRIVFPAASIVSVQPQRVATFEEDRPHITGPLIAMSIGAILGGIAGTQHGGVGTSFAGAAIGGLLFGGIAISIPPPTFAPRPQWTVRIPVGRPHRP